MNHGLKNLPLSLGLGKHTYITIKQNLFWAFAYNIVAIPVAALGFLNPNFWALVMGLSDVVLAINSVRLNFKDRVNGYFGGKNYVAEFSSHAFRYFLGFKRVVAFVL
jgi:hypothetical protein